MNKKIAHLKKLKRRKTGINVYPSLDIEEQMASLKRLTDDLFRPENKTIKPSYNFFKEDWYEQDYFQIITILRDNAKLPI